MSVKDALGYEGYSLPVGTVLAYAGLNVPQKYLLCDGSTISKSQYPLLFDTLDYLYGGSGDNFDLPYLVDNVVSGTLINADTSTSSSISTVTFNATLTQANIPSIPDSQFAVNLGTNPTYTATTGVAGAGVTRTPIGFTNAVPSAVPGTFDAYGLTGQLTGTVDVSFNSMTLEYTGTNAPISTALAGITPVVPTAYKMLYIIKAEY
jgi:microcystin-dependent protein